MKRGLAAESVLKPLSAGSQAYLSNAVQVADILEWILSQTGKSEVWMTTFSISEEFLRRLYFIGKSGSIEKFRLVLDMKATNKTIKLWNFIRRVVDAAYLADNHSKMILVRSASGDTVSVVTSQNLTRGNRHESAFITTDKDIFNTLHVQLEEMIKNHSVPLDDVLRQRIGED